MFAFTSQPYTPLPYGEDGNTNFSYIHTCDDLHSPDLTVCDIAAVELTKTTTLSKAVTAAVIDDFHRSTQCELPTPVSSVAYSLWANSFECNTPPIGAETFTSQTNDVVRADKPVSKRVVKHRQYDNQRRKRERAAFRTIQQLTDNDDTSKRSAAHSKIGILEQAIQTIQHLKQRVSVQETAIVATTTVNRKRSQRCNDIIDRHDQNDQDNIRKFTRRDAEVSYENLYSSLFISSRTVQIVINADTGCCLGVNDAYYLSLCCEPADIIGMQVEPLRQQWLDADNIDDIDISMFASQLLHNRRTGRMIPRPPRSKEDKCALMNLYRSRVTSIELIATVQLENGRSHSSRRICWLSQIAAPTGSFHDRSHITLLHILVP